MRRKYVDVVEGIEDAVEGIKDVDVWRQIKWDLEHCRIPDPESQESTPFYLRRSRAGLVGASCLSSFFLLSVRFQKEVKTAKTNMVAYVVWAKNFKSDFRFDLRGCLEATVASKPQFLLVWN